MRTADLIGPALDWAVTTIEEPEALRYGIEDWKEQRRHKVVDGHYAHRYHQVWNQAGPIIEREKITLAYLNIDGDIRWEARYFDSEGRFRAMEYGPTPLIATMRCYVAIKLGDEVEIPEVLK
jgi:hypothetical protein